MKKYIFYFVEVLLFSLFFTSCDSSFMSNNGQNEDLKNSNVSDSRTILTVKTEYVAMLSYYNEELTDHIYVRSDSEEIKNLVSYGYENQGFAFYVATSNKYDDNLMPLYRMYNQSLSDHIYTINVKEKEDLEGLGYVSQGIRGYVYGINDKGKTRQRVFRYYTGNKNDSDHIYSVNLKIDTYLPQGHRWYEPNVPVSISDPYLEREIRNKISKPMGCIFINDLASIFFLHLFSRGINSLDGIEFCRNLMELYISDNNITNLSPLAGLTNLIYLDIRENDIVDIKPLKGLRKLTVLDLSFNDITDIGALSYLYNLNDLTLFFNRSLSDITPLEELLGLKKLSLTDCNISDITSLESLVGLESLSLSGNEINNIYPIANLTNITHLDLSRNNISDIEPVEYLLYLTELSLRLNNITEISSLHLLNELNILDISYNKMNLTHGSRNLITVNKHLNNKCHVYYEAGNNLK